MTTEYHGTLSFGNCVSESWWTGLIADFGLTPTQETEMLNPFVGDRVTVRDPPNLLARHTGSSAPGYGIVRCSRMFFDHGVDETAEISFEGAGDEFRRIVTEMAKVLDARLSVDSWGT